MTLDTFRQLTEGVYGEAEIVVSCGSENVKVESIMLEPLLEPKGGCTVVIYPDELCHVAGWE